MDNVNGINVEGFQNIGSNIYTGNKNNNSNLRAINTSNIATNKNIINQTNYEIETIDFSDVDYIEEKKEENSFLNELGKVGATVAVGATSVLSGILKLGEWIQDGTTWIKGTVTSGVLDIVGADELAADIRNKTQEEIARDQVGEINEFFYDHTSVGQAINEASYLKYDSEIAQAIQNISTEATKWVAATALTVGTAGLAAPVSAMLVFGTGAVQGIGKSAEQRYQDPNNSSYDTGAILLDGVGSGFSWYASGKLGQGAVGMTTAIGQSIAQTGVKGTVSFFKNMLVQKLKQFSVKNLLNKDFYKNTLKNGIFDLDQLMDSASMGVNNITTAINTGTEIDWRQISKEIVLAYGLNCAFSGFTNLFSKNLNSNVVNPKLDINDLNSKKSNISWNSKIEADRLYQENLQKRIPGYDHYYAKQELMRNKSNLDKACEILDEWGKKNGYDNYAEVALRKYAETGSAYQIINGKKAPYITSTNGVRNYIETLDPAAISTYLNNKKNYSTLDSSSLEDLNSFFKNSGSSSNQTYGVNQGGIKKLCEYSLDGKKYSYKEAKELVNNAKNNGLAIPKFKKEGTQEYFDLKDKLVSRGFTKGQASIILSSIDDVGACSYAAKANSIFYKFSKNPELFEERFGFPMYKINANGEKILNSNELLLDMYLYSNDTRNGGNLILKNSYSDTYIFNHSDSIDVFGRNMLDTEQQVYMSTSAGSNNQTLNNYLNTKGLDWDSYVLIENSPHHVLTKDEFNNFIYDINASIKEGKAIQLNLFSQGNEIRMLNTKSRMLNTKYQIECTTNSWGEGGGHAVFVTGMNKKGFLVSSWGKEYLIPFYDLQNGGRFTIMVDDIKVTN